MSALPEDPVDERPAIALLPGSSAARPGRLSGLRAALARTAPFAAFALVPAGLAIVFLGSAIASDVLGLDFRQAFWPAGQAVLHGHSPYPPADPDVLTRGASFVYPPIVAIALVPISLLPVGVATALATLATLAALVATLRALGVRDWRCYSASLASPAVLGCIQTAAFSAFLALAIALAWRWRAHGRAAACLVVAAIAAKLFLWPLLLWLAVARGTRSALAAALGAVAVVMVPWLAGFPGLREYPRLLSLLADVEGGHAFTPRALALSLGSTTTMAEAAALLLGAAVLIAAGVRARRPEAERATLALAVLAGLLLSPVVWSHYFVVLLPVIAIARPRMGWAWMMLPALWLSGGAWSAANGLEVAVGLAVMVLAVVPALSLDPPLGGVVAGSSGHSGRGAPVHHRQDA